MARFASAGLLRPKTIMRGDNFSLDHGSSARSLLDFIGDNNWSNFLTDSDSIILLKEYPSQIDYNALRCIFTNVLCCMNLSEVKHYGGKIGNG